MTSKQIKKLFRKWGYSQSGTVLGMDGQLLA